LTQSKWLAVSNEEETIYNKEFEEYDIQIKKYKMEWMVKFFDPVENLNLYDFKETPPISSYLFAICAGPYKQTCGDPLAFPR
jgi:hypothetical protein